MISFYSTDMAGLSIGSIPISNYYEEQIYQLAQYIQVQGLLVVALF